VLTFDDSTITGVPSSYFASTDAPGLASTFM